MNLRWASTVLVPSLLGSIEVRDTYFGFVFRLGWEWTKSIEFDNSKLLRVLTEQKVWRIKLVSFRRASSTVAENRCWRSGQILTDADRLTVRQVGC